MPVDEYVTRVSSAVDALDAFRANLTDGLDVEQGGFAYWSGEVHPEKWTVVTRPSRSRSVTVRSPWG